VMREELLGEKSDPHKIKLNTPVMSFSIVMVIIGATLLLGNFHILARWGVWPLLLIVLGAWLYARRNH